MAERLDSKGRKLRTGEYWDEKKGRYKYRYKDLNGKWQTVYSLTLTHNDKVPAGGNQKRGESLREKEALIQKDLVEEIDSSGGNMSVLSLMERYIETRWRDVKQTTRNGYTTQLNFMKQNSFGKKKIKEVTEDMAVLWFDELHDKYGKNYSTLCTLRGILRPAFTMAKKNGYVRQNPFSFEMLKKRYGGSKSREALTREEMKRFLDFVRYDKHFKIYFDGMYILFNTGLRISEFCGLTVSDIDFKNHTIGVNKQLVRNMIEEKSTIYIEDTTKTDAGVRFVPMSDDVEMCFKRAISRIPAREKVNPTVVKSLDGKLKISGFIWFDKNKNVEVALHWENHFRWAVSKHDRIYAEELRFGKGTITPHVCRHTFCSNMASSGMAPKTLQYIMGHSEIGITLNVYTHVATGDATEEFRRLAKMMNGNHYNIYDLTKREADYFVPQLDTDEDEETFDGIEEYLEFVDKKAM